MSQEITKREVKDLIRVKFRNVRRFSEISGENYDAVRNMLNKPGVTDWQKNKLSELYNLARRLSNQILTSEISLNDRRFISGKIKEISGNVTAFCSDFPQFPRSTINDILQGRLKRKTRQFQQINNFLTKYKE